MKNEVKNSLVGGLVMGLLAILGSAVLSAEPAKAGWVGQGTVPKPFCEVVAQMAEGDFVDYGNYITRPGDNGNPMFLPLPKGKPTGECLGGNGTLVDSDMNLKGKKNRR